jgi:hypothetical protein
MSINEFGGGIAPVSAVTRKKKGMGPGSAGQSGDTQGLPDVEDVGESSVAELAEEGQYFEAEMIAGVEEAAEGGLAEVRTRQVAEDDVPREYWGRDSM